MQDNTQFEWIQQYQIDSNSLLKAMLLYSRSAESLRPSKYDTDTTSLIRKEIRIAEQLCEELDTFRKTQKLEGRPSAIQKLLDYWKLNHESYSSSAATFDNIMSEQAPVCIFGLPGQGKSHTLNEFCTAAVQKGWNVLLLDTTGERTSDFGKTLPILEALSFNPRKGFYRIIPESDLPSRVFTVRRFFEYLSMLQVKGLLREWCVVVDEANEYAKVSEFQNFLMESRKYCKKALVASGNPNLFKHVCKPMKPLSRGN